MDGVGVHLEVLRRAGRADDAARLFEDFVDDPAVHGTGARAAAWIAEARSRTEPESATQAWAAALRWARSPEQANAALLGIAVVFRSVEDWGGLSTTLRSLDARGVRDDALPTLRLDSALGRGDLGEGAALAAVAGDPVAPVLQALADATPTGLYATEGVQLRGGEVVLALAGGAGVVTRPTPELHPVRHLEGPVPGARIARVYDVSGPDATHRGLLGFDGLRPDHGELAIVDLSPDGPSGPVRWQHRWTETPAVGAVAADLDRDGATEVYVGTGPYTRRLRRYREEAGRWVESPVHPATDGSASDLLSLAAGDLDSDGRDELIVGAGPWGAYDVRVLAGAAPELELLARRKLGDVVAVARIVVDGVPRVAAFKSDRYPSAVVFPADRPTGEAPGLWLLTLGGGEFDARLIAPCTGGPDTCAALSGAAIRVGDFDGDGLDDLAVGTDAHAIATTQLLRQLPGGAFAAASVPGMWPLAAAQLDADPADELLVSDQADGRRTWTLGAGAPRPGRPVPSPEPTPTSSRREVAEAWSRTGLLVELGLTADALQIIESTLPMVPTDEVDAARSWGAGLADDAGRHEELVRLALPLVEGARPRSELFRPVVRALVALRRLPEAGALARRWAGAASTAQERAEAGAVVDLAAAVATGSAGTELPLDAPFAASSWIVATPTSIRRPLGGGGIRARVPSNADLLAALPVTLSGPRYALDVELDLEAAGAGGGFAIELNDRVADPLRFGFEVSTTAGAGIVRTQVRCIAPGRADPALGTLPKDAASGPLVGHIEQIPLLGETVCQIRGADGRVVHEERRVDDRILSAGPSFFVLRGTGDLRLTTAAYTELRLRRVVVTGAAPLLVPSETPAQQALVDGSPELAAASSDPWTRAAASLAAADDGAWARSLRALAGPEHERQLLDVLRAAPAEALPAASEVFGDDFASLWWRSWKTTAEYHLDRPEVAAAVVDPSVHPDAARSAEDRELLLARVAVWTAEGRMVPAREALGAILRTGDGRQRADAHLWLARLALADADPEAARLELARVLAESPSPEIVLDRIDADPSLRGLGRSR